MKIIINIFKFIFRVTVIFILMIVILLMCIFIPNSIEYSRYEKTGVMKNGNLCISHMCEGGGGHGEKYYNSDDNVLIEVDDFDCSKSIGSSTVGDIFGKVYQPIKAGKSDIYVGYATSGGEDIKYFELYHVEVDNDLNITYNMEIIDKERFEQESDINGNGGDFYETQSKSNCN